MGTMMREEYRCRHETRLCAGKWDTNKRLWMPSAHRSKDYHKMASKQLGTQSHRRTTTMKIIKSYSERIHWFEKARAQDAVIRPLYIFCIIFDCLRWRHSFVWIWQITSLFSHLFSPPVAPIFLDLNEKYTSSNKCIGLTRKQKKDSILFSRYPLGSIHSQSAGSVELAQTGWDFVSPSSETGGNGTCRYLENHISRSWWKRQIPDSESADVST